MARIVVAEDDADIRHLVTQLLVDEGHEVSAFWDGDIAVDKLLEDPPELLILDIMMPGLDGYSVIEELRDNGVLSAIKVMVLSARSSEQDFQKSYQLGAFAHVTKPFDPDELVGRVTELLVLSKDELRARREKERERAYLLSQLESIFNDG
ncbi:MAG TPA: response regulator transcription factor [Actinomycetota bacterium]|jgi:DNA-binding response OmpR family regulator|nr:response regulator transcription factor [Actinomycetota bacterium]